MVRVRVTFLCVTLAHRFLELLLAGECTGSS